MIEPCLYLCWGFCTHLFLRTVRSKAAGDLAANSFFAVSVKCLPSQVCFNLFVRVGKRQIEDRKKNNARRFQSQSFQQLNGERSPSTAWGGLARWWKIILSVLVLCAIFQKTNQKISNLNRSHEIDERFWSCFEINIMTNYFHNLPRKSILKIKSLDLKLC